MGQHHEGVRAAGVIRPVDDDRHAGGPAGGASALAGALLELESERRERSAAVDAGPLPGVGTEALSFKESLAAGGVLTFAVVAGLSAVDELESAALGTLAPDIRDTLHISSGVIVFLSAASGAFLIIGSALFGWLADRHRRGRLIAIATTLFSAMVLLSGLAVNALMLFFARLFAGVAKSNQYPVQGSLMADQYPIGTRGRMGVWVSMGGQVSRTLSPLIVAGIAAIAGGGAGWRWAFVVLSIPVAAMAVAALRLPEPPRGQYEKKDVVGQVIDDEDPAPISMEAASARLMQIRTLRSVIIGFAALGFSLFTVPVLGNLFLEDHYHLGTFGRGAVGTIGGAFVLVALPFVGRYYDRIYREDPSRALRLVGAMILPAAALTPVQYFMPKAWLFAAVGIPGGVLSMSAFAMVGPLMAGVIPYRLRGIGSALTGLYIFLIGATGGALLSAILVDASGPRAAVLVLAIPSTIIGGVMVLRGSSFITDDLALVAAEVREELDEHELRQRDGATIPAIQVHHVDFSYGPVQILFDVGFEVRRGEVLALLGTNGAGKSTVLRVIAGLGTPSRGVVRHHGRSVTFTSPEVRTKLGIVMLPGGRAVFGDMTVRENLEMSTFQFRADKVDMHRRIDRAFQLFPELAERSDQRASSLSGGQQQMLALAGVLTNDPDVLIIDELSLGLAPMMVARLVAVIEQLKAEGMTIVIVEQSLNVAAAVADRAVFLEKGHVRFEGAMAELVERDDLARAVFLGAEGG